MMFWYGWHMPFWQAGLIWGAYALITSLTRSEPERSEHAEATR